MFSSEVLRYREYRPKSARCCGGRREGKGERTVMSCGVNGGVDWSADIEYLLEYGRVHACLHSCPPRLRVGEGNNTRGS